MKDRDTSILYILMLMGLVVMLGAQAQRFLDSEEVYVTTVYAQEAHNNVPEDSEEEDTSSVVGGSAEPEEDEVSDTSTVEEMIVDTFGEDAEMNDVEKYIHEVFGEDADRGIKMLKECENKSMNTRALNWNGNGTSDHGLWQINSIHGYTQEQLSDYRFNTDVAHKIFKAGGNSFYFWTCGYVAGDEVYWE